MVNKQRIILLFEAAFNFNNKVLGSTVMKAVEVDGTISIEQYRSRKDISVDDQCLNKRLTHDQALLLNVPIALLSKDLKACYDRIIHSIAALCIRRLGAPVPQLICMFTTPQKWNTISELYTETVN